jgi:hypothetical protein
MTMQIQAAARLASKVTAAAEGVFKYDDGFKKIWKAQGDGATIKTKKAGTISVNFLDEDELGDGGNLQTDVPSLFIEIGGKKTPLTWNEAYNLADRLNHLVSVAYYG